MFDDPFGNLDAFAQTDMASAQSNRVPTNVQSALDLVQNYIVADEASVMDNHPQRWFSEAPNLERYDASIVNVFLNLAVKNLGSTFKCLEDFAVIADTRCELYMAVAATGGLFCQMPGSYAVAEAMYHDSRRILLSAVSLPGLCPVACD